MIMEEPYYPRKDYLEAIEPFLGKKIIKVIIGMRRSGKSYFLKQLKDHLFSQGLNERHFLLMDMERLELKPIRDYKDFADHIDKYFQNVKGKKVLFVDEIQEIKQWEKVIRSYLNTGEYDIVITGSSAHLLSSEIATLLAGRTIEVHMFPFSFKEFIEFNKITDTIKGFKEYLIYGGMPAVYDFHLKEGQQRLKLLNSICNTIVLKDVVGRYNVRNVVLLEEIIRYILDNIGNIFSAQKIVDYLKSQKQNMTVDTVRAYLGYLESALIIHKAKRFDVKGKRLLEIHEKYYVSDVGLRHSILGYREADISSLLENIVYLELKRRGYTVCVGKLHDKEIDFIAERPGMRIYFQITLSLANKEVAQREFGALLDVKDNFPKYVLSLDEVFTPQIEGIPWLNVKDFLLNSSVTLQMSK